MEESQPSLKKGAKEQHESVSKWRDFCVPYKLALFVLASLKLVLSLAILIEVILSLFLIFIFSDEQWVYIIIVQGSMASLILVVDFLLSLMTSPFPNVKNLGLLGIYYKYTVYVCGSLTFVTILGCIISHLVGISVVLTSPPLQTFNFTFLFMFFGFLMFTFLSAEFCLYYSVRQCYEFHRSND